MPQLGKDMCFGYLRSEALFEHMLRRLLADVAHNLGATQDNEMIPFRSPPISIPATVPCDVIVPYSTKSPAFAGGNTSLPRGICCALHSAANSSSHGSWPGANSPKLPETGQVFSKHRMPAVVPSHSRQVDNASLSAGAELIPLSPSRRSREGGTFQLVTNAQVTLNATFKVP